MKTFKVLFKESTFVVDKTNLNFDQARFWEVWNFNPAHSDLNHIKRARHVTHESLLHIKVLRVYTSLIESVQVNMNAFVSFQLALRFHVVCVEGELAADRKYLRNQGR